MAAVQTAVKSDPDASSTSDSVTVDSTPRSLPPFPQQQLFRCPFYGLCEMQPTHDYAQIAVHLEQQLCFASCRQCSQPIRLHDAGSHRCPDQQTTTRTRCPGPNCNEAFTRPNNLTSHLNRPRQAECRAAALESGRWIECPTCLRVLDGKLGLSKHATRCVPPAASASPATSLDEAAAIDALQSLAGPSRSHQDRSRYSPV